MTGFREAIDALDQREEQILPDVQQLSECHSLRPGQVFVLATAKVSISFFSYMRFRHQNVRIVHI